MKLPNLVSPLGEPKNLTIQLLKADMPCLRNPLPSLGLIDFQKLRLMAVHMPSAFAEIKCLSRILALKDILPAFMKESIPSITHHNRPSGDHIAAFLNQQILLIQPSINDSWHVFFHWKGTIGRQLSKPLAELRFIIGNDIMCHLHMNLALLCLIFVIVIAMITNEVNVGIMSINIIHRLVFSYILPIHI